MLSVSSGFTWTDVSQLDLMRSGTDELVVKSTSSSDVVPNFEKKNELCSSDFQVEFSKAFQSVAW
jgi:hypothetical protein